jgi:hypothetical protein
MNAVWNELEKENKEFFESYIKSKSGNEKMMSQEETTQMLQEMISSSDSSKGALRRLYKSINL